MGYREEKLYISKKDCCGRHSHMGGSNKQGNVVANYKLIS